MKISNNALNFLLAQYRAIFKRAYIKGLASAVILTAGLAAGQAQAADSFWEYSNSKWNEQPNALPSSTNGAERIAGDYDTGTGSTDDVHGDGTVSGAGLIIGDSGAAIGGNIVELSSGSAYGGYVAIESGDTKALAQGNTLTVKSGATINSSTGNVVGGWAKTKGTGFATAQDNKLIINAQAGSTITFTGANQFLGAMAGGQHGALAQNNRYEFHGNDTSRNEVKTTNGHLGAIVFVGDDTHSGSSGMYQALGNTLDMSNFTVSGNSTTEGNKTFIGGWITVSNLEDNHNIELLRAKGNEVKLTNFELGKATEQSSAPDVGNIVANRVTNDKGTVASVEANGADNKGVVLTNGKIHGATVFGGFALNVSGGSAEASNNLVQIIDTDFLTSVSGSDTSTTVYNGIFGGHAESTLTNAKQTVNLTASNNTVTIETKAKDTSNVHGSIRGAELYLTSGGAGITDAVGSNLTADYNSITIGEGITVTEGSIQGVYLGMADSQNQNRITSGGATLHASDNIVTLNGK